MSPIAGTTRDIIESSINIDEYPIVISDTAGLRKSNDVIEIEGVKRTLQRFDFKLNSTNKYLFSKLGKVFYYYFY